MSENSTMPISMALEAILMVVDEPVSALTLAQIVQIPTEEVIASLEDLLNDSSWTVNRPDSPKPRWRRWLWWLIVSR
jgi:chromosome segregation and condensation protein ScpB